MIENPDETDPNVYQILATFTRGVTVAELHGDWQVRRFWLPPAEVVGHTESVWGDGNRIHALLPGMQEGD